jgi:hypothetical protein
MDNFFRTMRFSSNGSDILQCNCGHHFFAELAIKKLALSLFTYNKEDLDAFWKHKKKDPSGQFKWSTAQQLVMCLPLSDMRRFVRREYLQPEAQLKNLQAWYEKFLVDPTVAVTGDGRHLVAGGPHGFHAFNKAWESQLALVQRGLLSGECMLFIR